MVPFPGQPTALQNAHAQRWEAKGGQRFSAPEQLVGAFRPPSWGGGRGSSEPSASAGSPSPSPEEPALPELTGGDRSCDGQVNKPLPAGLRDASARQRSCPHRRSAQSRRAPAAREEPRRVAGKGGQPMGVARAGQADNSAPLGENSKPAWGRDRHLLQLSNAKMR